MICVLYFNSVYVNPGYSEELLGTTTFQQVEPKQHPQHSNFGNTDDTSNNTNTITRNVHFVDEEGSPVAEAQLEDDTAPRMDEKESATLSTSMPKDIDNDKSSDEKIAVSSNGVTQNGMTPSSVHLQDPANSHAAPKRKSFGVRN